jgi:hypothetical protein
MGFFQLFYHTFSGTHVTQNGDTCFVTLSPQKQAQPNTVPPLPQTRPKWRPIFNRLPMEQKIA